VNLGVFGGTFNPVHVAHLRVAEEVRETLALPRILWIPAADPPHKRESIAPATHRLEMVRLATAANPCFEVDDLELRRDGPSYTVDTLRALGARHREARLWLVLGADAVEEVGTWHQPEALFELANVAVVTRPGEREAPLERRLPQRLMADFRPGPQGLEHPSGHEVREIPVSQLAISASDLRQRIARGASIRYLVPEPVIDYIQKHRLYREEL
jgi:nicotinate-nucleotide adenylyltransferase